MKPFMDGDGDAGREIVSTLVVAGGDGALPDQAAQVFSLGKLIVQGMVQLF